MLNVQFLFICLFFLISLCCVNTFKPKKEDFLRLYKSHLHHQKIEQQAQNVKEPSSAALNRPILITEVYEDRIFYGIGMKINNEKEQDVCRKFGPDFQACAFPLILLQNPGYLLDRNSKNKFTDGFFMYREMKDHVFCLKKGYELLGRNRTLVFERLRTLIYELDHATTKAESSFWVLREIAKVMGSNELKSQNELFALFGAMTKLRKHTKHLDDIWDRIENDVSDDVQQWREKLKTNEFMSHVDSWYSQPSNPENGISLCNGMACEKLLKLSENVSYVKTLVDVIYYLTRAMRNQKKNSSFKCSPLNLGSA